MPAPTDRPGPRLLSSNSTFDAGDLLLSAPLDPIEDLSVFDGPNTGFAPQEISFLAKWLEQQTTCTAIMKQHGDDGLHKIMIWTAQACSDHDVPMPPRIRSVAIFNGIDPL